MSVAIRAERSSDEEAIHALTAIAFAPMPYSSGKEPAIIRALRASGELTLSLVADDQGALVGHVAFSPVTINGIRGGWFGLGPISVQPERQRQGIGRALIAEGLAQLKAMGATGCVLIGDPAVYRGSGFVSDGALDYEGLDRSLVQRVVFHGAAPGGSLAFAAAFDAAEDPASVPRPEVSRKAGGRGG